MIGNICINPIGCQKHIIRRNNQRPTSAPRTDIDPILENRRLIQKHAMFILLPDW